MSFASAVLRTCSISSLATPSSTTSAPVAVLFVQTQEAFAPEDFTQFFEDPESIKLIKALFKRLGVSYESALAGHRERRPVPTVSSRLVPPELLPDADPLNPELPFYTQEGTDDLNYTKRKSVQKLAEIAAAAPKAIFESDTTDADYESSIVPTVVEPSSFPAPRSPRPSPPPHRVQEVRSAVHDAAPSRPRDPRPAALDLPPHHYRDQRVVIQEPAHRVPRPAESSPRTRDSCPREPQPSVQAFNVPSRSRPYPQGPPSSAGPSIPRSSSHAQQLCATKTRHSGMRLSSLNITTTRPFIVPRLHLVEALVLIATCVGFPAHHHPGLFRLPPEQCSTSPPTTLGLRIATFAHLRLWRRTRLMPKGPRRLRRGIQPVASSLPEPSSAT
ncbi:hypothetical protein B0H13DRAFT_1896017 [Mycena leptocephala]|nr:hypothetical protein B0H13DRAFT_1896017 [Mycena leptocephala]